METGARRRGAILASGPTDVRRVYATEFGGWYMS